ncbi:MAG: hypothetical protein IJS00_05815 [Paludibacteraceae bacterium]|nr:hypothetical protein [Paludibacteraceae bacterium]
MKKLLFLVVAVSALLACTNKNDAESGGVNNVLGKSFKYHDIYEVSGGYGDDTKIISFPSRYVCHIYFYGYEDSYGDRDRWSKEDNLSYTVEGNTIITEEISEWGYGLTLTYSGGNLIDGSDVYVYNGTVDLDPSLDNTILPEGKRSYIPDAWFGAEYSVIA